MPKWVAEQKKKKKEETGQQKKVQSPSVSNNNRKQNAEYNNNLKQRRMAESRARSESEARRLNQPRRYTTTAAQRQKMGVQTQADLDNARREREERAAKRAEVAQRQQRVKSGTETKEDRKQIKEEHNTAKRALKNTPELMGKAVKDTVQSHGQTIADVTEMTAEKGTAARAMKMGIQDNPEEMRKMRQRQKLTKEKAREDRLRWAEEQDQRQAEWDEKTKDAKGLEKAWYGAVESGTGMATDLALGLGTQGGALAAMFSRTYGSTRGQAEKEGATENEDRLYAFLQGAKEVGTELMFPGAGLAKGYAGRVGLPLAERIANRATRNMAGRAADVTSAGIRLLGGTAEENAEEAAGWLVDPALKELTYGRNVRTRQAQDILKQESDELRSNLQSEEDAQYAAAYLGSDQFLEQNKQQYMDAGLSEKKATQVAELMREYLTASLTGDTESMADYEKQISDVVAGKSIGEMAKDLDLDELKDTFASTSVLTLVTGLPGGVSTAVRGSQIREALGSDGIRALAETAVDFENAEDSLRAEVAAKRMAEGKELTSTQVFDLTVAQHKQVEKDVERVRAKKALDSKAIEDNDFVQPRIVLTENGSIQGDEMITKAYAESSNAARNTIRDIDTQKSLTDTEVDKGSRAIAGFKTGAFTINDANALNYSNTAIREAFQKETGVDLNEYVVKGKDGKVDIPATNTKTKDALFALASENFVKSAEVETANWMDKAKGETVTQITQRMDSQGAVDLQYVLDDVDERNRSEYLMVANAADMAYQAGRNIGTEWENIRDTVTSTFSGVSEDKLHEMYEAGRFDRDRASDNARGRAIRQGERLSEMGDQENPMGGQVFIDTEEPPKGTMIRTFSEIASTLGVDIHLTDEILDDNGNAINGANGQYYNGAIYINVNTAVEKNVGYIFMHEVTHHLRKYAPEQYAELEKLVREKWFQANPEQMQDEIARRISLYERATKGKQHLSEDEALEEIIADAAHEFLNDRNFANQVAEESPSLAMSVLNSIRNGLRMLRQIVSKGTIEDDTHMNSLFSQLDILSEAEELWLNAYKQAVQNRALVEFDRAQTAMFERPSLSVSESNRDELIQKFGGDAQVRFSVSDSDYMDAVENGDTKSAQKMVDKAAKAAGFTVKGYHGTTNNFNTFKSGDIGFHFGKNKSTARTRVGRGKNARIISAWLSLDNPIKVDVDFGSWDADYRLAEYLRDEGIITPEEYQDALTVDNGSRKVKRSTKGANDTLRSILQSKGYDGIEYENYYEAEGATSYIVFDAAQIKNAEPVTYDDNGEVIPLSERFNQETPDIRYSVSEMPDIDQLDQTNSIIENEDGDMVAEFKEDGSVRFSISSFEKTGRKIYKDFLNKQVKNGNLSKAEADDMLREFETVYKISKDFADAKDDNGNPLYLPYTSWSYADVVTDENGKPVFSAIKQNSEYKMNIDFSTICKKRRTLDAVFREMINRGMFERLDLNKDESAAMVVNINNLIRKNQFEAACALCFVEARRYRQQQTATTFKNMWNEIVESMYPDKSKIAYFNFGEDSTVENVTDGIDTMDDSQLDLTHVRELATAKNDKGGLMQTAEAKAARLILSDPSQRKLMRVGDMMASTGFENMQVKNPELMKVYNSKKGTGGAKSSFGDVQYLNEILKPRSFSRLKAYAVSGVRIQSFSDYVPRMVFDYVQVIADLAAKKLPAHAYTKEPLFAKQFGLTGAKINLSLVPDVVADSDIPGLDKNGNYVWNEEGTFPYDEAMKLQKAEGYKENCGTIAVGISDEQIMKMLADPTIQMVIPYHKSSLNPIVAAMTNVSRFKDYTDFQNTKDAEGKAVAKEFAWDDKLFQLTHTKKGKLKPKDQWGDPQDIVKEYAEWCEKNNYTPKFPQFLYQRKDNKIDGEILTDKNGNNLINPGYYKLLEDFALYDNDGNFKPQLDVQMKFPTDKSEFGSMKGLIQQGLSEDTELEANRSEKISGIVDEIEEMFEQGTLTEQSATSEKLSARLSISEDLDEPYMDAVNSGNMEEAQRLVDEAAERAGYKTKAYHGTPWGGFTEFNTDFLHAGRTFGNGIYLTSSPTVAEGYTFPNARDYTRIKTGEEPSPKVYGLFIKDLDNALEFEWENYTYNGKRVKGVHSKLAMIQIDIEAEPDKDVIIRNIRDGSEELSDVYVIKNSSSLKSADPVTYAEDGSVIPLSERFDPENNDIRYSLPTQDADGNILSNGQMEYFKNSQARDEQGRLVPVFHGTNQGGFTMFDPLASDDFRSLFFTSNFNVAMTYANADYRLPENEESNPITQMYRGSFNSMEDFLSNAKELYSKAYRWNSSQPVMKNLKAVVFNSKTRKHSTNIDDITEWLQGDSERFDTIEIMLPTMDEGSYSRRKDIRASSVEELLATINTNIENAAGKNTRKFESGYYQVYLNLEKPMIVNANGAAFDEILYDGDYYDTRGLAEVAYNNGYDGVIISNCLDINGASMEYSDEELLSDIYIAFSSNQVKDTRNTDPSENPDIRYSITPEEVDMEWINETAETLDDNRMWLGDAELEEGRQRKQEAIINFVNKKDAEWNQRWLTDHKLLNVKSVRTNIRKVVMAAMAKSNLKMQYKTEIVDEFMKYAKQAFYAMKDDRHSDAAKILYNAAYDMLDKGKFFYEDETQRRYNELRDYLNAVKFTVAEDDRNDLDEGGGYAQYRKKYQGRIFLVEEGGVAPDEEWQMLNSIWPELFPDDIKGDPAGIMDALGDALDALKPKAKSLSDEWCLDWAADIADELYTIVYEGKEYKSIADTYKERYAERAENMKARHKEAVRQVKAAERERAEKKLAKQAEKFNTRNKQNLANQKVKYEGQIDQLKQNREYNIQRLKAEKARQRKEIKREERERQKARKNRELHKDLFEHIEKNHKTLTDRLLTNTADKNIPEYFKHELSKMLASMDLQTMGSKERELKKGPDGYVRADLSNKTIQMLGLHAKLMQMHQDTDQYFCVNEQIKDLILKLQDKVDGKTIDQLPLPYLQDIDNLLTMLVHEFNNYNNVKIGEKKREVAEIGQYQINWNKDRVAKFGMGNDYYGLRGAADRILNMDELTPAYLFRRIDPEGKGLGLMYKQIRKSFDKYIKNTEQLNKWMDEIVGEYHQKGIFWNKYGSGELTKWRSSNYALEFKTESGRTISLTPAQMMSIHCLANRAQAKGHMKGAGIVVAPVTFQARQMADLKKKANTELPVKLTDADIQMINARLTKDQLKVADKLQELMATKMADWGNEASMEVLGIKLFTEKNYFPIRSDKAGLTKDLPEDQFAEAIRSFGFTKAVQPRADNAIMVQDIFDVVTEHCNNMNLYNSYSKALDDFMKVYNYKEITKDSKVTVEQTLANAYSRKATTYIMSFLKDLNGNVSGRASGLADMFNATLASAKKASVFANIRVFLQQPTAFFRAFAVISPKYIGAIRHGAGKKTMQEMFEHCPIALWKSWGYYDINMGKSIDDVIMNNGKWLEDKMTDAYGAADNMTWAALWQMCKAQVEDTHPGIEIGSDVYWDLVNDKMTEVVDFTQVVDSPMHRSHAMRAKDVFIKLMTSFMAEPTLTFNMVRDGFIRAYEAVISGDKTKGVAIAAKTSSVFLVTAAATSAFAAVADVIRGKGADDDDDEEQALTLAEKLQRAFDAWKVNTVENFKDNAFLPGNIYYVKDIISLFQGFGINNLGFQGWKMIADGWAQLTGTRTVRSSKTWYENLFGGLGYIIGVPIKTIMQDFGSLCGLFGVHFDFIDSTKERLDSIQDNLTERTKEAQEAKIEKDSAAGSILSIFGVEAKAKSEDDKEKTEADKEKLISDLKEKTADLSGESKDKKIWSAVTTYAKDAYGVESYADLVADGRYNDIADLKDIYLASGGKSEYFDKLILKSSKSALKKSIIYDPSSEQIEAQESIKDYLLENGMSEAELSEIAYKSDTTRELKMAFRLNDEDAIIEELVPLIRAGLSFDDFVKAYENRNRVNLKTYDGKYKDRFHSTGTYQWPISGQITSGYGHRSSPGGVGSTNHKGIDIAGNTGDPIGAADGGVVTYVGWYYGGGNTVMIQHDDGTVTEYMHMSAFNCKEGDTVAQGQTIGQVGSTGNSTGPHCHFGVKVNGEHVDPLTYLQG